MSVKRGVKFWTRYTWESTYTQFGAVLAMGLVIAIGAEGMDWAVFAAVVPYLLFAAACVCMVLINHSSQILYAPLLISMGETRRNVFFGFHYYRALITLVTLAVCALIWALVPGEIARVGLRSLPTLLAGLVLSSSLGSLLGTAYSRWRWVSVMVIMLIAGCAGGTVGVALVGRIRLEEAGALRMASMLERLPVWLVLAAGGMWLLDVAFHWTLLRRQEVKLY